MTYRIEAAEDVEYSIRRVTLVSPPVPGVESSALAIDLAYQPGNSEMIDKLRVGAIVEIGFPKGAGIAAPKEAPK